MKLALLVLGFVVGWTGTGNSAAPTTVHDNIGLTDNTTGLVLVAGNQGPSPSRQGNTSPLPRKSEFDMNLLSDDLRICGARLWAYGDTSSQPQQMYNAGGSFRRWPGWSTWTGWGGHIVDDQYYYDAAHTFYGIADYTGDPQWATIARRALTQAYLPFIEQSNPSRFAETPPKADVPVWRILPWGPFLDWQRNPDPVARSRAQKVLFALANDPSAFGYNTNLPANNITDVFWAREVGYNLTAKYLALDAGYSDAYGGQLPWGLTEDPTWGLLYQAFRFLDQWTALLQGGDGGIPDPNHRYVRPFMVANLAEGMIHFYEHTNDTRVIPKLSTLFDLLWSIMYMPNGITLPNTLPDGTPAPAMNYTWGINSMRYTDRLHAGDNSQLGSSSDDPTKWLKKGSQWSPPSQSAMWPAPELNGLILPIYFWLYQKTGEQKWMDRADLLFDGLVRVASMNSQYGTEVGQGYWNRGKVFNQMYSRIWPYVMFKTGR